MRNSTPLRRSLAPLFVLFLVLAYSTCAFAQLGNGKLQIHHIDVGQGDGILIVSPQGQLAIVDDAAYNNCAPFVDYITGLGITNFDYNFASHYHADHIGCLDDLMGAGVVLNVTGYDRGYSYSSATYDSYVAALGNDRATISKNQTITLDAGAADPVTIKCVDLNGAGVYSPSGTDENAKSVVLKVSYGNFDEVLGGDLTGGSGNNVESTVGPMVGDVEVYKVHHHGAATSTNDAWLTATTPEVGVICVGDNSYGHPTADALTRLHNHNVKTYWTEVGSGASPVNGWDKVGGNIIVQADPGDGAAYTVSGTGFTDTYYNGSGGGQVYTETYYPTAVTMLIGTIGAGSYASLAADDASYLRVNAAKSGNKYYTDWYGKTVIAETPTELTITYNGKYSASRTQTLYLYNFATSSWTSINSGTVGTTDVTKTYTTTSPANFVSATGEIRVRVAANGNSKTYSCYGDYLAYTIKYVAPTSLASGGKDDGQTFNTASGGTLELASPQALVSGLAAWPNPFNPTVRIAFELDRPTRGEVCVYDVSGHKVAVLASGALDAGRHLLVWGGRDSNGNVLGSGVYIARLEGDGVLQSLKLVMLK